MLKDYLAILVVPLRQHEHVLQRSLSDHVVRVGHKDHKNLHGGLKRYFVIIVNHQGLIEGTWRSVQYPLQTRSVQVLKFISVVVDLT